MPLKPLVPSVRRLLAPVRRLALWDRHTHTHTQDKYCNPRCACAPRVNYDECSNDPMCIISNPVVMIQGLTAPCTHMYMYLHVHWDIESLLPMHTPEKQLLSCLKLDTRPNWFASRGHPGYIDRCHGSGRRLPDGWPVRLRFVNLI